MPIDLAAASDVSPAEAPITEVSGSIVPLAGAPSIVPIPAPLKTLDPLPDAGVRLSKWLLTIISIFLLITVIWLWWSEQSYSGWLRLDQFKQASEKDSVAQMMLTDRASFRDFWFRTVQLVLLNVLLPVLTAILGYTFGSSKDSGKQ